MFALVPAIFAWFLSQCFKYLQGQRFFDKGGMPSSHAAFTVALAAMVYAEQGLTTLFAVILGFCLVVMYDAHRRHSLKAICSGILLGLVVVWFIS